APVGAGANPKVCSVMDRSELNEATEESVKPALANGLTITMGTRIPSPRRGWDVVIAASAVIVRNEDGSRTPIRSTFLAPNRRACPKPARFGQGGATAERRDLRSASRAASLQDYPLATTSREGVNAMTCSSCGTENP